MHVVVIGGGPRDDGSRAGALGRADVTYVRRIRDWAKSRAGKGHGNVTMRLRQRADSAVSR